MAGLHIDANGRGFIDNTGRPFFWLGDTQWELIRRFTPVDAESVVRDRKEKGFTVLQVMLTGVGDGSAPDLDRNTPWKNDDPSSPNEPYFRRVDRIIEMTRREGIVLVLGIYHQLQAARFSLPAARSYARWVASRYRTEPHLVWSMYPKAEREFAPVVREIIQGLREGDGGMHPVTIHPDPSPTSSSFFGHEEWLSFHSIQTWVTTEYIVPMVRADAALEPPKPVVMAEGGYEGEERGDLKHPLEIRKQAFWSHLAGGHFTYGHDYNWLRPEEWRSWIDSPGARQMGIFRDIVTMPERWWDRVPDRTLLDGEGEERARNLAARSPGSDGRWIMAYVCGRGSVEIRLDCLAGDWPVRACRIDPATGRRDDLGNPPADAPFRFQLAGDEEDAVLWFV